MLGLDGAVAEMDRNGLDFYLFVEEDTGQDSVLYRSGPQRYRLAQVHPDPHRRWKAGVPLTVFRHPAPHLTLERAIDRLEITGLPFLFFASVGDHRGQVLYRRPDGGYGLLTST
jgi:hypothetical protein